MPKGTKGRYKGLPGTSLGPLADRAGYLVFRTDDGVTYHVPEGDVSFAANKKPKKPTLVRDEP